MRFPLCANITDETYSFFMKEPLDGRLLRKNWEDLLTLSLSHPLNSSRGFLCRGKAIRYMSVHRKWRSMCVTKHICFRNIFWERYVMLYLLSWMFYLHMFSTYFGVSRFGNIGCYANYHTAYFRRYCIITLIHVYVYTFQKLPLVYNYWSPDIFIRNEKFIQPC